MPLPRLSEADGKRLFPPRHGGRRRGADRGNSKTWAHFADSGNRITHHFCPDCGSTVHYRIEGKFDGLVAIPLGSFDDPYFLKPRYSVWEERKHDWVEIFGEVEHSH